LGRSRLCDGLGVFGGSEGVGWVHSCARMFGLWGGQERVVSDPLVCGIAVLHMLRGGFGAGWAGIDVVWGT